MMTVSSPSSNSETLMNISTDTDYLNIAKKGGGHKGKGKHGRERNALFIWNMDTCTVEPR